MESHAEERNRDERTPTDTERLVSGSGAVYGTVNSGPVNANLAVGSSVNGSSVNGGSAAAAPPPVLGALYPVFGGPVVGGSDRAAAPPPPVLGALSLVSWNQHGPRCRRH